ncbi:MAG: hypothetical protein ABSD31_10085 [Candidatus Binataceae bacterium]|jgi:Arc/MetJ-type ribon-helix-helix transcriptional regulator
MRTDQMQDRVEELSIDDFPTKDELLEERVPNPYPVIAPVPKGVIVTPLKGVASVCAHSGRGVPTRSGTGNYAGIYMEKKRLQLDFSESAYRELQELQERLNAPSKSEVIRDALGVLRWLQDEVDKNHRVLVEKPEGIREVVFHFLTRRSEHAG